MSRGKNNNKQEKILTGNPLADLLILFQFGCLGILSPIYKLIIYLVIWLVCFIVFCIGYVILIILLGQGPQ